MKDCDHNPYRSLRILYVLPFFTAPLYLLLWVFFFFFLLLTLAFRCLHGILLYLLTLRKEPYWLLNSNPSQWAHPYSKRTLWMVNLFHELHENFPNLSYHSGWSRAPTTHPSLLHPEGVCDLKLWQPFCLSPHFTPPPPSYIGISSCKIFALLICKLHLFLGLRIIQYVKASLS